MNLDLLNDLLVCPNCKIKLQEKNGGLVCQDCNNEYKICDDIPVMLEFIIDLNDSHILEESVKTYNIQLYGDYNKYFDDAGIARFATFMNLGYIPNENKQYSKIDIENIKINKNSIKHLLEVIGEVDLTDRKIVDIGCGRGGNIATILNFFKPSEITGLDISIDNIRFCKRSNRRKNVGFCVGDAENIPFADNSFDTIVNIESSYAYPNRFHFFNEAYRILSKGGYFLYADVLDKKVFKDSEEYLEEIGFDIVRSQDITSNVVSSCMESSDIRMESLNNVGDDHKLKNMVVAPGSNLYDMMIKGAQQYKILTLKKR